MKHFLSVCLVTVLVLAGGTGCAGSGQRNPQEPLLYANLWVQTSAEYYAICEQTYAMAFERVAGLAKERASEKPLAVVMDLDDTVIDNSGFQTYLHSIGGSYTTGDWEAYVMHQADSPEAKAVPGAVEFIRKTEELGVTMVFISNREESSARYTLKTLGRLGVDTDGLEDAATGRLLLQTVTSSKEARRKATRERYEVIAWFGDNLADFAGEFEAKASGSVAARREAAERQRARWGSDWFVLPNPVYGDYLGVLEPPLEKNLVGPSEL